jgi:hypothetical protein
VRDVNSDVSENGEALPGRFRKEATMHTNQRAAAGAPRDHVHPEAACAVIGNALADAAWTGFAGRVILAQIVQALAVQHRAMVLLRAIAAE